MYFYFVAKMSYENLCAIFTWAQTSKFLDYVPKIVNVGNSMLEILRNWRTIFQSAKNFFGHDFYFLIEV